MVPESFAQIIGLPLTDTMRAFGITGMVQLDTGWNISLTTGQTILVPHVVGYWLATNKLPTEK